MAFWFQRKKARRTNFERLGGVAAIDHLTNLNIIVYQSNGFWWAEDTVRQLKAKHSTPEQCILMLYWHIVEHEKDYLSHDQPH